MLLSRARNQSWSASWRPHQADVVGPAPSNRAIDEDQTGRSDTPRFGRKRSDRPAPERAGAGDQGGHSRCGIEPSVRRVDRRVRPVRPDQSHRVRPDPIHQLRVLLRLRLADLRRALARDDQWGIRPGPGVRRDGAQLDDDRHHHPARARLLQRHATRRQRGKGRVGAQHDQPAPGGLGPVLLDISSIDVTGPTRWCSPSRSPWRAPSTRSWPTRSPSWPLPTGSSFGHPEPQRRRCRAVHPEELRPG